MSGKDLHAPLEGQTTIDDVVVESEEERRAREFKEKLAHWRRNGVPVQVPHSFRAV